MSTTADNAFTWKFYVCEAAALLDRLRYRPKYFGQPNRHAAKTLRRIEGYYERAIASYPNKRHSKLRGRDLLLDIQIWSHKVRKTFLNRFPAINIEQETQVVTAGDFMANLIAERKSDEAAIARRQKMVRRVTKAGDKGAAGGGVSSLICCTAVDLAIMYC